MRAARTATLLIIALLALLGAGCGGSSSDYQEVPGPPATVPIPDDQSSLEGGGGNADDSGNTDDSGDANADSDATPTPTPDAGGAAPDTQSGSTGTGGADTGTADGTGGTDSTGTTDGGGAAAPDQDSPTADATPEPGSDAQQFEDFCSQNPGAC